MRPKNLPIYELETEIVEAFREKGRVVLEAPTGSGKTTQVPQILLDNGVAGDGQIVVLQPRRLATRMLASRVAAERGGKPGAEVGYQIRFDNVTSAETRIKFVTEGILLRMMLDNPSLPGISILLFDEFHERHLFGDITLARALQISKKERPDLKIGVMSATLDAAPLEEYLAPCQRLTSGGRTFPVEINYLSRASDIEKIRPWDLAAREVDRIIGEGAEGDVLVFMPGAYEIHRTISAIEATRAGRDAIVLPLHGGLPPETQDAAVGPQDRRKIIVSTNVAETSLTIDGIRIVVDSGLARISIFDPYRGINTLLIEKISQASADQRAGRAGRTAPGTCIRLWTEKQHQQRQAQDDPEIRRVDISEVILTLKASGVIDISDFPWLDAPEPRALETAESLLTELGALDHKTGAISPIGRKMLKFPVHPRFSRMLLAAEEYRCVPAVALAAALTQSRNIILPKQGKKVEETRDEIFGEETESDFFLLMRAWQFAAANRFSVSACRDLGIHARAAREAGQTWHQLMDIARRQNLVTEESPVASDAFRKCLLAGFSDHLAIRVGAGTLRCQLTRGRRGTIARESVVQNSPLFIATEVKEIETHGNEVTVLLTNLTAIEEEWLEELFPDDYRREEKTILDPDQKRVVREEQRVFRDLILGTKYIGDASPEEAAPILAEEVLAGRITLKNWNHGVDQWIARVNSVAEWMPELEIPVIDEEARHYLIEQICYGAVRSKEVRDRPVLPIVRSWLSPEQQNWVKEFAPEQISLPSGRKPKIIYEEGAPPTISTRLQDLYGVTENLKICAGRIHIRFQILAPNQRPVQITENIAEFWRDSYPDIKKQLQGRYPKHEWR